VQGRPLQPLPEHEVLRHAASRATTIAVTDIAPARLAVARRNGATATLDALEDLDAAEDFDALLDCSGVPSSSES